MTILSPSDPSPSSTTPAPFAGARDAGGDSIGEAGIRRCRVLTLAGRYVTSGTAVIIPRADMVEARVTRLSEPGALLTLHVANGARWFVLELDGSETRRAELISTAWQSRGQRLCRFALHPAPAA